MDEAGASGLGRLAFTTFTSIPWLQAAIAEAGFMTGLERNSEVVQMAAYAPLFVHKNSMHWPTNLIIFDNHRHDPSARIYLTIDHQVDFFEIWCATL